MVVLELILITLIIVTSIYTTITDIRSSVIQNKVLIISSCIATICNVLYYGCFCRDTFQLYITNLVIISIISILFFAFNIWGAGDSKLLMFVVYSMPARFYFTEKLVLAPAITLFIIIFSIAFIYIIFESIVIGIKEKNLFSASVLKIDFIDFMKNYIIATIYITVFNQLIVLLMGNIYNNNIGLIMLINMFFILSIFSFDFFKKKITFIVACCTTAAIIIVSGINSISLPSFKIYFFVILLLILRRFGEKYNYKIIPTEALKRGMILSLETVMYFQVSRIKGLPETTTEDLRSKLTQEEVDNVIRWKDSKYGKEKIIIVRKIPFAIFIALGFVIFISLRMVI